MVRRERERESEQASNDIREQERTELSSERIERDGERTKAAQHTNTNSLSSVLNLNNCNALGKHSLAVSHTHKRTAAARAHCTLAWCPTQLGPASTAKTVGESNRPREHERDCSTPALSSPRLCQPPGARRALKMRAVRASARPSRRCDLHTISTPSGAPSFPRAPACVVLPPAVRLHERASESRPP